MAEPVVGLLEAVWADLSAVCEGLGDDDWERPTDLPGWSVKDVVAHVIGTERMLRGEQAPPVEVPDAPHVRNDIGRFNEQWVLAHRDRPGAEVLAELRAVTRARLDDLAALPPHRFDEEGFTPEGPGPYRQFMAIRVFDCWYHDQDVREALGRPGFLDGPVADFAVARIPPKGLPFVVGKKAAAPAGTTVVFEVTGASPLVAAVGVPPEGRAVLLEDVPADPTVRATMDRRTFTRLAGGRWAGARALAEGRVRIEGDEALGRRVVEQMAYTI